MLTFVMGDLQQLPTSARPAEVIPVASVYRGGGIHVRSSEMPISARNPLISSAMAKPSSVAKSEGYGPHRSDRDLLIIIRAVLAENPYQFAKIDRGPIWKRVMKRLQKEGLTTNIKVVRQRLRRNLRAHRERKRSPRYKPTTSTEIEKDGLLDQLEGIAKLGVYAPRPCTKQKPPVSYSMAPNRALTEKDKTSTDWRGDVQLEGLVQREQNNHGSVNNTAPPRKGIKLVLHSTSSAHPGSKSPVGCKSPVAATAVLQSFVTVKNPQNSGAAEQNHYRPVEEKIPDVNEHGRRGLESATDFDNDLVEDIADEEFYGHTRLNTGVNDEQMNGPHALALNDDEYGLSSEDTESNKITSPRQKLPDIAYPDLDDDLDFVESERGTGAFFGGGSHTDLDMEAFRHYSNGESTSYTRRGLRDAISSHSISEEEPFCLHDAYGPLNTASRPSSSHTKMSTELQKLELWREEITLSKQRFAEEQLRRKMDMDMMLARDKFEREMAVQRLAFDAEQRDKDRDAETKRHALQMKCHSEMQELQIRAQQDQNKLMLEMIKLLRSHNAHP